MVGPVVVVVDSVVVLVVVVVDAVVVVVGSMAKYAVTVASDDSVTEVVGSRLPSGSLSLKVASMVTSVSSLVVALSSVATGGSLVGVTVMETLAVAHSGVVSQTW